MLQNVRVDRLNTVTIGHFAYTCSCKHYSTRRHVFSLAQVLPMDLCPFAPTENRLFRSFENVKESLQNLLIARYVDILCRSILESNRISNRLRLTTYVLFTGKQQKNISKSVRSEKHGAFLLGKLIAGTRVVLKANLRKEFHPLTHYFDPYPARPKSSPGITIDLLVNIVLRKSSRCMVLFQRFQRFMIR